MKAASNRRTQQSGSTMIEFALASLILIPCCLGVVGVGMTIGNYIKILQTVRDTGHMFARGIDFESDGNKDIVVRLASTLNITRNGGNGVLILSKIITPTQEDCAAANLANNCPNRDRPVIMHRMLIGNAALPNGGSNSRYGTPLPAIVSADGNIRATDYLRDASALANGFAEEMAAAGIVQGRGEIAYVVEGYFTLPSLSFLGYAPEGAYCHFMF